MGRSKIGNKTMAKDITVEIVDGRMFCGSQYMVKKRLPLNTTLADLLGDDDEPCMIRVLITQTTLYGSGPLKGERQ